MPETILGRTIVAVVDTLYGGDSALILDDGSIAELRADQTGSIRFVQVPPERADEWKKIHLEA